MTTARLLLETSKKLNAAYAAKKYQTAYILLQVSNRLREELGQEKITLKHLEARFQVKQQS